ncbi:MAG: 50S ribosomal protein L25/general stress protein Ctc [Gammaproteobacteria bacterium]
MDIFEIEGELRHDRGKGASRRLRRAGKLPAIVYGGHKDPVAIEVSHNEMLLHTEHEAFYSHILSLKLDGRAERVVLKDMQRHPYKPFIMHMDFLRVSESEAITIRVPLHFVNEDRCVGVKQGGGVISHLMSDLEITCLPKDLPEYIEVDLVDVNLGESIHLSELKLPAGVEITSIAHGGDAEQAVVSVHAPRGGAGDAEDGEAGEAGGEG